MKTGIFETKYYTEEGQFTCKWLMIFGKCLFIKHKAEGSRRSKQT